MESLRKNIFPSKEDKIRESVDVGSVFLALKHKFIIHDDILEWLINVPVTEKTKIAYKAVCQMTSPNVHYLKELVHFLVKKPEYGIIAIAFNLKLDTPAQLSDSYEPIFIFIEKSLKIDNNDVKNKRETNLIINGTGSMPYIQKELIKCFRARNSPHLRNISADEINNALIESDWTEKLRYKESLASLILNRIVVLQQNAPTYYAKVAYSEYYKVAIKMNNEKLLCQLNRNELNMFDSFFSGVIDRRILTYSDIGYQISLLNNDIAGYVLGYPIQSIIPNDDQIRESIDMIEIMGIKGYVKYIQDYVKKTYMSSIPLENNNETVYSNITDVMLEEIDIYSPFDIVSYQAGSHIFRFTRVEFDKIIETKKNQWTNNFLPPTILGVIKGRCYAAKELGLPTCRPIIEMLERTKAQTLFDNEEHNQHEGTGIRLMDIEGLPNFEELPALVEQGIEINNGIVIMRDLEGFMISALHHVMEEEDDDEDMDDVDNED